MLPIAWFSNGTCRHGGVPECDGNGIDDSYLMLSKTNEPIRFRQSANDINCECE